MQTSPSGCRPGANAGLVSFRQRNLTTPLPPASGIHSFWTFRSSLPLSALVRRSTPPPDQLISRKKPCNSRNFRNFTSRFTGSGSLPACGRPTPIPLPSRSHPTSSHAKTPVIFGYLRKFDLRIFTFPIPRALHVPLKDGTIKSRPRTGTAVPNGDQLLISVFWRWIRWSKRCFQRCCRRARGSNRWCRFSDRCSGRQSRLRRGSPPG